MAIGEATPCRPESDREHRDAHPAPTRYQEMAELVAEDDDGQYERKGNNHVIQDRPSIPCANVGEKRHATSFRVRGRESVTQSILKMPRRMLTIGKRAALGERWYNTEHGPCPALARSS